MIRLAVRVRREQAELVLAELLELAPAGVEEREQDGGTVEFAIYGPPGELPALPELRAAAGGALVEVSTSEVAEDWHERWRAFHRPVELDAPAGGDVPGVRVRPPWEPAVPPGAERLDIAIDPGQAFGTGAHATTRLCLELLLELAAVLPAGEARPAALDVGTGSGVLAIVAARLGFAPVAALDNDPLSLAAARENAAANQAAIEVRRFDLRRERLAAGGALLLANLLRPLLLELATSLDAAPDHLIAGGLLREEADELASAFAAAHGLRERARRAQGEWAALWLARA